jgi:type III pantothenate kinase
MMLLVDIGNTAVKWALHGPGDGVQGGRIVHHGHDMATAFSTAWGELPGPGRIVVANVAGDTVAASLADWTDMHWSLEPEFIRTEKAAGGVSNAYDIATDLGVDRWAALVGAHHHVDGPVCVIDCGTAITIDLLSAEGQHLGGVILPGVGLLKGVLLEETANVLSSQGERTPEPAATNTGAGVHNGAVHMAVAAIDRIVDSHVASQGDALELVITGGDASEMLTLLARRVRHEPELVLKGLAILAGET